MGIQRNQAPSHPFIDGITADATLPPKGRGGKMFFSPSGSKYVDVVDDATLAGMNAALPVARQHFMTEIRGTGVRGSLSRHGVMHGRELGYDTKAKSTKTFVLLAAVVEWAQPRIRAEIDRRRSSGTSSTRARMPLMRRDVPSTDELRGHEKLAPGSVLRAGGFLERSRPVRNDEGAAQRRRSEGCP